MRKRDKEIEDYGKIEARNRLSSCAHWRQHREVLLKTQIKRIFTDKKSV